MRDLYDWIVIGLFIYSIACVSLSCSEFDSFLLLLFCKICLVMYIYTPVSSPSESSFIYYTRQVATYSIYFQLHSYIHLQPTSFSKNHDPNLHLAGPPSLSSHNRLPRLSDPSKEEIIRHELCRRRPLFRLPSEDLSEKRDEMVLVVRVEFMFATLKRFVRNGDGSFPCSCGKSVGVFFFSIFFCLFVCWFLFLGLICM